jgi:hypothetical protein
MDDHYLGYTTQLWGVGAKHWRVGYTRLFGQISRGTDFFPQMKKKSVFGDFWLQNFDLIFWKDWQVLH